MSIGGDSIPIDDLARGTNTSYLHQFNNGGDSSSSLLLHNSDDPGINLVTTPLTGSNYLTWSRSMKIALIAKQKLGFVNGKLEQPDVNSKDYEQWLRVDCMVISWILNSKLFSM